MSADETQVVDSGRFASRPDIRFSIGRIPSQRRVRIQFWTRKYGPMTRRFVLTCEDGTFANTENLDRLAFAFNDELAGAVDTLLRKRGFEVQCFGMPRELTVAELKEEVAKGSE